MGSTLFRVATRLSKILGQIYGIFAGISDYPGEENDLDLTDQDALRARDALLEGAGMNPNNAYTLLDGDATLGNFTSAMSNIGSEIGPDDTLVIFYSGHGSQHSRTNGPNNTEQVAYKFEAGGYLAVFFEDAVRGHFADGDMNSQLTPMELSEYIHERYRFDVKPEGSEVASASARVTGPASLYRISCLKLRQYSAQHSLQHRQRGFNIRVRHQ